MKRMNVVHNNSVSFPKFVVGNLPTYPPSPRCLCTRPSPSRERGNKLSPSPVGEKGGVARMRGKGFTLIELLVVVLIIGILAAVALPQYQKAVKRSRVTQALVTLDALQEGAEMYFLQTGKFPSLQELNSLGIDVTETENVSITRPTPNTIAFELWPAGEKNQTTPIWSAYIQRNAATGIWTWNFCLYLYRAESADWREPLKATGLTETTQCGIWY